MVILTVTDSDMACHWELLPFNSDSGTDRQWLWLSLRVIDFLCDGNSNSDGLWLCLSIKVIAIVMVIQTMTDSDCVCH